MCQCLCFPLSSYIEVKVCDPMDCSPPGSSLPRILQARILEWGAMPFLQGIFQTLRSIWDLLHCRQILYHLSHQVTYYQLKTKNAL